jgi:lysophospholipase L1-like esterase
MRSLLLAFAAVVISGFAERGWGQALHRYFDRSVTVENHAVNGRGTKSFIAEGRWDSVRVRLKKGDYVFVEFGHNDEKVEDSTRYTNPYTGYRRNLERLVVEARATGGLEGELRGRKGPCQFGRFVVISTTPFAPRTP